MTFIIHHDATDIEMVRVAHLTPAGQWDAVVNTLRFYRADAVARLTISATHAGVVVRYFRF
jgi:hypothetical protein